MSAERDDLAAIIGGQFEHGVAPNCSVCADVDRAADAVITDGWVKPRTITTVEELVALPNSAVIRDRAKDVAEKRGGLWCQYETSDMTDRQMAKFLPATVLDEGQA